MTSCRQKVVDVWSWNAIGLSFGLRQINFPSDDEPEVGWVPPASFFQSFTLHCLMAIDHNRLHPSKDINTQSVPNISLAAIQNVA